MYSKKSHGDRGKLRFAHSLTESLRDGVIPCQNCGAESPFPQQRRFSYTMQSLNVPKYPAKRFGLKPVDVKTSIFNV